MRFYCQNVNDSTVLLAEYEYACAEYMFEKPYLACDPVTKTFECTHGTGVGFCLTRDELSEVLFSISVFANDEEVLDDLVERIWEERATPR